MDNNFGLEFIDILWRHKCIKKICTDIYNVKYITIFSYNENYEIVLKKPIDRVFYTNMRIYENNKLTEKYGFNVKEYNVLNIFLSDISVILKNMVIEKYEELRNIVEECLLPKKRKYMDENENKNDIYEYYYDILYTKYNTQNIVIIFEQNNDKCIKIIFKETYYCIKLQFNDKMTVNLIGQNEIKELNNIDSIDKLCEKINVLNIELRNTILWKLKMRYENNKHIKFDINNEYNSIRVLFLFDIIRQNIKKENYSRYTLLMRYGKDVKNGILVKLKIQENGINSCIPQLNIVNNNYEYKKIYNYDELYEIINKIYTHLKIMSHKENINSITNYIDELTKKSN